MFSDDPMPLDKKCPSWMFDGTNTSYSILENLWEVSCCAISASTSCICAADCDRPCPQQLRATPPVCFLKWTWRPGERQLNMLGRYFATVSYTVNGLCLAQLSEHEHGRQRRLTETSIWTYCFDWCWDLQRWTWQWSDLEAFFTFSCRETPCTVCCRDARRSPWQARKWKSGPGTWALAAWSVISVGLYREKGYRISANYFHRELFFQCQLFFWGGGVLIFESRSYTVTRGEVTFSMSSFPFWHKFRSSRFKTIPLRSTNVRPEVCLLSPPESLRFNQGKELFFRCWCV